MGNSRFVYNHFLKKQQELYTQYKEQLQLFKDNKITKKAESTLLSATDMSNILPQLKRKTFSFDKSQFINFASNNQNELSINSTQFEALKIYWLKEGLSTSLQQSIRHLHKSKQ